MDSIKPPVYAAEGIYRKCKNCGLLSAKRDAVTVDLQTLYNEKTLKCDEKTEYENFYKYHMRKLKFMLHKAPNRNLLTVGCGLGLDVKIAQGLGFNVSAVEKSIYALNFLKENFKINLAEDIDSISLPDNEKFGIIYMSHILEHFENPKEVLKKLLTLSEEGSYFIVSVPNPNSWAASICRENWAGWSTKEHYHCFSKKTLTILFRSCNLKIVKIYTNNRPAEHHALCWQQWHQQRNTLTYKVLMFLHKAIRVRLLSYAEKVLSVISKRFNSGCEIVIYAKR